MFPSRRRGTNPPRRSIGRGGPGRTGPTPKCQRCLQEGHATYECSRPRVYVSRPTRSQALVDKKASKKFRVKGGAEHIMPPDETDVNKNTSGTANAILAAQEKDRAGSKRQRRSVSSTSSRSSRSSPSSSSSSYDSYSSRSRSRSRSGSFSSSYDSGSYSSSRSGSRSLSRSPSRSPSPSHSGSRSPSPVHKRVRRRSVSSASSRSSGSSSLAPDRAKGKSKGRQGESGSRPERGRSPVRRSTSRWSGAESPSPVNGRDHSPSLSPVRLPSKP